MTTIFFEATGLVAAALTTLAFLPQVVQTWRSRTAAGLSLPRLVALATGVALWLVYGLGTGQVPVILANGVTLGLVAVLLGLKLREVLRGVVLRGVARRDGRYPSEAPSRKNRTMAADAPGPCGSV
jgi:MtN3 and saliva related transmembrane protein